VSALSVFLALLLQSFCF